MNVADEHSRWAEDLPAYAIGALDARETVAFAAHVADCDRCRAELHRLAPAVELLPASVEQLAPPPELRGRIMAAIGEADAAPEGAAAGAPSRRGGSAGAQSGGARSRRGGPTAPGARPRGLRGLRERLRGWHVPVLPAALGAAALAAAFAIGFAVRGDDGVTSPQRTTVPVAATRPAVAPVRAQLVSDGGAWRLDVARMPPLPAGRVYQAWVMRDGRDVEPSTVFVLDRDGGTTVAIPQSLNPGDQVLVTREPRGGSPAPTAQPLLQAQV